MVNPTQANEVEPREYDLVIANGSVLDPESGIEGRYDIGVIGGRIRAISGQIPTSTAAQVIDAHGLLVVPGLIDLHTHVGVGDTLFGAHPDIVGVEQGVTTVVDAGSRGTENFERLAGYRTRVLQLLNVSQCGFERPETLRFGDTAQRFDAFVRTYEANPDSIVGAKVVLLEPLRESFDESSFALLQDFCAAHGLMLMVHFGDKDHPDASDEILTSMLDVLRCGDVLTHVYTPNANAVLDTLHRPTDAARAARARGVVFDVGRGRNNFTIDRARGALKSGFVPDTISSDITRQTLDGPVYGLLATADCFVNLGLPFQEVLSRVTSAPAAALGRYPELGSLRTGAVADIALLHHVYDDNGVGHLEAQMTIRDGVVVHERGEQR